MSPEQAMGDGEPDARSDIYSLGAVAYFALAGRPPFEDDTPMRVLIAHARDHAVPPSQFRSGVPADLEAVVLQCLMKDPDDRYQDAECLESALAKCAASAGWNEVEVATWWNSYVNKAHSATDLNQAQESEMIVSA